MPLWDLLAHSRSWSVVTVAGPPARIDWRGVPGLKGTRARWSDRLPCCSGRCPPLFAVPGLPRSVLVSRRLQGMTIVERAQIALAGD